MHRFLDPLVITWDRSTHQDGAARAPNVGCFASKDLPRQGEDSGPLFTCGLGWENAGETARKNWGNHGETMKISVKSCVKRKKSRFPSRGAITNEGWWKPEQAEQNMWKLWAWCSMLVRKTCMVSWNDRAQNCDERSELSIHRSLWWTSRCNSVTQRNTCICIRVCLWMCDGKCVCVCNRNQLVVRHA